MTLQGPPLYPDELVTSAVIRCCRRYGLPAKRFRTYALESPFWQWRFLCFSALPSLARMFRTASSVLLWEHSAFPYATAYLDGPTYAKALHFADHAELSFKLGTLSQNATAGQGFRRYCSSCAASDRRAFGESYWHRCHNLPGVEVCPTHGEFLRVTRVPVDLTTRLALDLPGEGSARSMGRGDPPETLIHIATGSARALAARPDSRPGPATAQAYRSIAEDSGWLGDGAQVNSAELNRLVVSTLGRQYLLRWKLLPQAKPAGWPGLMLRDASCHTMIPLKHIVLSTLLQLPRDLRSSTLNHRPPGPGARHASSLDAECSSAARDVLQRLLAAGVTNLATKQFLTEAGCWGYYKRRVSELPRLRAVVLMFRSSTVSMKQLGPGKTLYRRLPHERTPGSPRRRSSKSA